MIATLTPPAFETAANHFRAAEYEEAERICLDLVDENPGYHRAIHLLALIASHTGRWALARERVEKAIEMDPGNATYRLTLGRAHAAVDHNEKAVEVFRGAVAAEPARGDAHAALGWALAVLGRFEEAIPSLERNVELRPDDVMAHLQLSAVLHRRGDFTRAWREYEWRTRSESYRKDLTAPEWEGSDLTGGTLLLLLDGGLGDQLQFVRYAPLAAERSGARLIVACHPLLHGLVARCAGVHEVVASTGTLPECDRHVYAMSLPAILGTTTATIPAIVPYLWPDPVQADRWKRILTDFKDLRVGINWEGNRQNTPGASRALPLSAFYGVLRRPGAHFFSLQKGAGAEQLAETPPDVKLYNLGKFFADFPDTAAAVSQLDLVITNDTSVAHLAGAMGKPVWIILPKDKCWRWLDHRDDSPWYPSARLFRQEWGESWAPVMRQVEDSFRELLRSRAAS